VDYLTDTNTLLRSAEPAHPLSAAGAAKVLIARGENVCVLPQNLIEFWNAATRPADKNGLGLAPAQAEAEVSRIESLLTLVDHTGLILAGRPSLGAWVTYGLGTANQNLPVFYLAPPETVSDEQQRGKLAFLSELNQRFSADKSDDTELLARLRSYELAHHMQSAAPEAVDLSKDSEATKRLYGMDGGRGGSKGDRSSARRMRLACGQSSSAPTSTTFTRRSSTCSAATSTRRISCTTGATNARPSSAGKRRKGQRMITSDPFFFD
jgi:hypothetical protein